MKKLIFQSLVVSIFLISLNACKSDADKKEEPITSDSVETVAQQFKTYHGEFIHVDTAAVLKGNSYIYGIKMDSVTTALINEVEPLKKDPYDVVNIIVKGELQPNDQEGWEEILTIKSVEKVYPPNTNKKTKVIKYSTKQNE